MRNKWRDGWNISRSSNTGCRHTTCCSSITYQPIIKGRNQQNDQQVKKTNNTSPGPDKILAEVLKAKHQLIWYMSLLVKSERTSRLDLWKCFLQHLEKSIQQLDIAGRNEKRVLARNCEKTRQGPQNRSFQTKIALLLITQCSWISRRYLKA